MTGIHRTIMSLATLLALSAGSVFAACENPLLPVVEGAQWTYRDSDGSQYTQVISEVTATGFTMTQDFDGETFSVAWQCTPDGLLTTEMTLPLEGFEFETLEASGVTFPDRLVVGDSWNTDFTVSGSMVQEGMEMSFTGVSTSTQTVLRVESVTVPAGTWDAFVLEAPTSMTMSATMMGMVLPLPPFEATATTWIVEGVGMVRTETSGQVTELIEFSRP